MNIPTRFIFIIFGQLKKYGFMYLLGAICLYFNHKIQSVLPFYAKELGDLIEAKSWQDIHLMNFIWLALGIILFRTSSRFLFFYPARKFHESFFISLLKKLENAPPGRYLKINTGQIYQMLYEDLDWVKDIFGFAFIHIVNIIIALAILLPKLASFSPKLLLPLSPMALSIIFFTIVMRKFQRHRDDMQSLQGEVNHFLIETYEGKKTIKNYHSEASFLSLFQTRSKKELQSFLKSSLGPTLSMPMIRLGMAASLLWGIYVLKKENLGASSLILYSGFVFLLSEPLTYISWVGFIIGRVVACWKRIKNLIINLDTFSPEEQEILSLNKNQERMRIPFWKSILELTFTSEKWTVLIGNTGCGKSTVLLHVAMILKQKNVKYSYVGQNPFLYNDTLQNNLLLGMPIDDYQLQRARYFLELFSLQDLSDKSENILQLEVGENGKLLSGGQMKRVALIRSLLSETSYLLWDDPFSSVDVLLERKIIAELKESPEVQKKTIVLTAHRLSTVRFCDELFYLDKDLGIIEQGKTQTLLISGSRTSEFFQKQLV